MHCVQNCNLSCPCLRFGPYYIEPVIAGLDPKTFEPFICSLDLIGCPMVTEDFVVSGTCSEQMYGMCESLWEPDMVGDHVTVSGMKADLWSRSGNLIDFCCGLCSLETRGFIWDHLTGHAERCWQRCSVWNGSHCSCHVSTSSNDIDLSDSMTIINFKLTDYNLHKTLRI